MSFFGLNIKKIRIAKKLSQQDFAKLFALTRSAIGAYEEGRAEAKIDKIIEIANYFGINLTGFLTKKLTLNEILKYDARKVTNIGNKIFETIPYIENSKLKQYLTNRQNPEYINRQPKISMPGTDNSYRAFEIVDAEHFLNHDIVVCTPHSGLAKKNKMYLLVDNQAITVNHKISKRKNFLEIWEIKYTICQNINKINTIMELTEIKKQISLLNKKL